MKNKIVELILKNDRKELLNLAFNLNSKFEFDQIFDFFVTIGDANNLGELISICPDYVGILEAEKIVKTENQEFIFYLLNYGPIKGIVDSKFLDILKKFIEDK